MFPVHRPPKDLTLEPDLEKFTFDGTVKITCDVKVATDKASPQLAPVAPIVVPLSLLVLSTPLALPFCAVVSTRAKESGKR